MHTQTTDAQQSCQDSQTPALTGGRGTTISHILPTRRQLELFCEAKYGDVRRHGWRVRMRHRFGYVAPETCYESVVDRLVKPGCVWIDVGGGKSILPENRALAEKLARRCGCLVGVDPSETIAENSVVHERAQCAIEDYRTDRRFDLATMRMVAEHIVAPEAAVASLARLLKPDAKVVIYTPNGRSPMSLGARLIPFQWHPQITGFLWQTKDEDVFPTVYRMNSRRKLRATLEQGGFKEIAFKYLESCCLCQRIGPLYFLELSVWRACHSLGLRYPENNLLGVYEKM